MSFRYTMLLRVTVLGIMSGTGLYAQQTGQGSLLPCRMEQEGMSLQWQPVAKRTVSRLPSRNGAKKLPLKFTAYSTDAVQLDRLLTVAKGCDSTYLLLPMPGPGCLDFYVRPSGTLSPGLAAKYPELVSLKGQGIGHKSAAVRVDYNGKEMNAEILWQGTYYIIAPWKKGKKIYYIVYRKQDAGIPRHIPAQGEHY